MGGPVVDLDIDVMIRASATVQGRFRCGNGWSAGGSSDGVWPGAAVTETGPPEFRADTRTEGEGYTRKERRQSCHHDGTETQERSFVDRLRGREAASPFHL